MIWVPVASAIIALAAWPHFVAGRSEQAALDPLAAVTPAPVLHAEAYRDRDIAFYEKQLAEPNAKRDQITPRIASGEYMQRYRETGDVGDILRAQHEAELSLAALPHNPAGDEAMASALVALHRFKDALRYDRDAERHDPSDPAPRIGEASLELEIGEDRAAKRLLDGIPARYRDDIGYEAVTSRYDELHGDMFDARRTLNIALRTVDASYDITAERRAWYHFRVGELDWLAGDTTGAIAQEKAALAEFPHDPQALNALARFDLATKNWKEAVATAQIAAEREPLPETLGYEADAQAALGDTAGAAQTRDQILAIERIGNAYRINDRLLAIYFDDHDIRLADAYAIAKRELSLRDDLYTEDTLAWAAAKVGRWDEASRASAKALSTNVQDSRVWYHAGIIALHGGDRASAKMDLAKALALNPSFHPAYADDARSKLASL